MDGRYLSPRRARFNQFVTGSLDRSQVYVARHWLGLVNWGLAILLALPLIAPVLVAAGHAQLAHPIYWVYQTICHQWPFRSFFLFGSQATYTADQIAALASPDQIWTLVGTPELGYKMAFCERDLAIVAAGLAMGLMYVRVRGRLAPPTLPFFLALLIPIALDGFTQLFGLRESTWELRVATGAITGAATIWLFYPYFELIAARWLTAAAPWINRSPADPAAE